MNRRIRAVWGGCGARPRGGLCRHAQLLVAARRGRPSSQGQEERSARVPVDVATAVKKSVPVRIDLLGTVTPIASVAVKPRIDSEITDVHFDDGAMVRKGDMLFTLDSRAIDAQIRQTRASSTAPRRSSSRRRATSSATPSWPPRTRPRWSRSTTPRPSSTSSPRRSNPTPRSSSCCGCSATTPSSARRSPAASAWRAVKVGNYARQADPIPLATIIQVAPVYVTFSLPQRYLPELRQSLDNETATIEAIVPGDPAARQAAR